MKNFSLLTLILCVTVLYCHGFCLACGNQASKSILKTRRRTWGAPNKINIEEFHKTSETRQRNDISIFSKLTFTWLKNFMRKGHERVLDLKDLDRLDDSQQSVQLSKTFNELYEKEIQKLKNKNGIEAKTSKGNVLSEFMKSPITKVLFSM
jgi:hypothetical protein